MKKRIGFVANSSSSSFIVKFPKRPETVEEMQQLLSSGVSVYDNPYANLDGLFGDEAKNWPVPCSFCEGEGEWKEGISILECKSFIKDVWYHPLVVKYRNLMIENGRHCPLKFGDTDGQKKEMHAQNTEGNLRSFQKETAPEIRYYDRFVGME